MNNGLPYINIQDTRGSSSRSIIVSQLPEPSSATQGNIYMVVSASGSGNNMYDEYKTVFADGQYSWEFVGSTTSEDKMKLVVTSDTTINANVNTYYNSTSSSNVTLNLPQIEVGQEFVEGFIIYTEISSTKGVNIIQPTGVSVVYADGFDITEDGFWEINFLYNGNSWLVTGTKFNV